ncbi:MAG: hypothetical protein NDJ90_13730 [Oligoflexia bacterium]|nr:hypothetical protein [Oligoflexia bacterium]
MDLLLHRAPSVGNVVKKILEVNPALTTREVIAIVNGSLRSQGGTGNEFSSAQSVDEARALELARESLRH